MGIVAIGHVCHWHVSLLNLHDRFAAVGRADGAGAPVIQGEAGAARVVRSRASFGKVMWYALKVIFLSDD